MDNRNAWDEIADFLLSPWVLLAVPFVWFFTGKAYDSAGVGLAVTGVGFLGGVAIRAARGKV
jgi:hypothetical protein